MFLEWLIVTVLAVGATYFLFFEKDDEEEI